MAKSKWEDVKDKLDLVEGWARDGLIDPQIAHNLGISLSTLKDYKKRYPTFLAALKKGKEVIDYEVENALLKRALGYSYIEETQERIWDREKDDYVFVTTKKVKKEVQPDTTAQIFWLKNRKPKQWRDKVELDKADEIDRIQIINDLPGDEDGTN